MTTSGVPIRYLWAVHYSDGTELVQTPEDVSARDPSKNAWADVDVSRVAAVALVDAHTGDMVAAVDMATGFFVIGGRKVALGDNPPHDPAAGAFTPLCFRQIQRNQSTVIGPDPKLGPETVVVRYCIGWESKATDGRTYRQVFGVY